MTDFKKMGDQFVNSCQQAARNAINHNARVEVQFTTWTESKLQEPKIVTLSYPPPPPPPPKTAIEQENQQLRQQLQELSAKHASTENSVEVLRLQLEFLRLEFTK